MGANVGACPGAESQQGEQPEPGVTRNQCDPNEALPDSLRLGLNIVFVGTAAGRRSAAVGAYYAHRGNKLWRTLDEVGLTPRRFEPAEFRHLLDLGMGFTDIAKRAAGMDHEIAKSAYDRNAFAARIERSLPRIVAFTSKKAASIWLGRSTRQLCYGLQSANVIGAARLFVLPSPSGAASRHWSIEPWRELAAYIRLQ
mgnify:CR=1 FL=1